jgi:hypothetical protein
MGRVTVAAALGAVLAATGVAATPGRLFPRHAPKETRTANIEVGGLYGWSPLPTQAPMGPPAVDLSLEKRFDKGSDTCGFAEGFKCELLEEMGRRSPANVCMCVCAVLTVLPPSRPVDVLRRRGDVLRLVRLHWLLRDDGRLLQDGAHRLRRLGRRAVGGMQRRRRPHSVLVSLWRGRECDINSHPPAAPTATRHAGPGPRPRRPIPTTP